jgi:hypothetical protein
MLPARSPRLRRHLSAAAIVIAFGAALLCLRDPQSAPDPEKALKRTRQAERAAVAVVPLHTNHLDDARTDRPHPLDLLRAVVPGPADTAEARWAPFGLISEEEEASRLQQREVNPPAQKLPAGAIEHIIAELENELQEKGGRYGYNSRH